MHAITLEVGYNISHLLLEGKEKPGLPSRACSSNKVKVVIWMRRFI